MWCGPRIHLCLLSWELSWKPIMQTRGLSIRYYHCQSLLTTVTSFWHRAEYNQLATHQIGFCLSSIIGETQSPHRNYESGAVIVGVVYTKHAFVKLCNSVQQICNRNAKKCLSGGEIMCWRWCLDTDTWYYRLCWAAPPWSNTSAMVNKMMNDITSWKNSADVSY